MKHYLRLMLGQKSIYAAECFANNYIGIDFGINEDLTGKLPEDWQTFNKIFVPKFLENHPEKSKVAAGLACGALWTVSTSNISLFFVEFQKHLYERMAA